MPDDTERHKPDEAVVPAVEVPAPETTPPSPEPAAPVGDYTESGVPTFEYVRDKIEQRFATALGAEELASATEEATSVDELMAEREKAARERLEQLRRSLRQE